MSPLVTTGPSRLSLLRRALTATGRFVVKALKLFVILLLVILPVPIASLFASALRPRRRGESAQVLKKE